MKPPPFDYCCPETLEEALALLAEHGEGAKVIAGGQSLVPMLNLRALHPAVLIDINRLPGLDYISLEDGQLRVGALARHKAVLESVAVAEAPPSSGCGTTTRRRASRSPARPRASPSTSTPPARRSSR